MPAELSNLLTRIDLRHLRYFVAVAEAGSISAAAQRLHLSQPPLSVTVKELEATLGVQLLMRFSTGVQLTEAGKALLVEARSVLARTEQGLGRVLQTGRGERGLVRIGILGSLMWGVLPNLISAFVRQYPDVRWSLHEFSPAQQLQSLLDRGIDVALIRGSFNPVAGLKALHLAQENLVAVLPATHVLAHKRKVGLADLVQLPFLSMDPEISDFGTTVLAAIRSHGHVPQIGHVAREPQTLLALAANGVGFSLLAGSFARVPWPGVAFVPVVEKLPPTHTVLYVRDPENSPAVARFIEVVHSEIQ
jgi:DNA-binding transcriptional LysR family regulator